RSRVAAWMAEEWHAGATRLLHLPRDPRHQAATQRRDWRPLGAAAREPAADLCTQRSALPFVRGDARVGVVSLRLDPLQRQPGGPQVRDQRLVTGAAGCTE